MKLLRPIILAFLTMSISLPSYAGAAIVQTVPAGGVGSTTQALTLTSTLSGDTLIVSASVDAASTTLSISDNKSDTYTLVESTATGLSSSVWLLNNITSGITTVTVTFGSSSSPHEAVAREYSGLATSALDTHTSTQTTGTNPSSGASGATSSSNEVVVGAVNAEFSSYSATAGSGFGNLSSVASGASTQYGYLEDKTVSSTGAQTATFTSSSSAAYHCAVLNLIIAGSSTTVPTECFARADTPPKGHRI